MNQYDSPYTQYNQYQTPVKKKKAPAALIAVMAVVLVIAVVACIVAAVIAGNPVVKVGRALKASIRAAESSETVETVVSTLETGSVEVEGDLRALTSSMIGLEIDAGVRFKSYFNTKNRAEVAWEAALTMRGADLVDASLYTDGDSAAMKSETLFGKKAYGLKFDEVRKKFDDSVFGPDGEYALGIEGEDLAKVLDLVSGLQKAKNNSKKLVEDTVKDLLTIAVKHAKTTKDSGTVSAGDKDVKTEDVTMTFSEEDLHSFILECINYLRTNKDIRNFLEDNLEKIEAISEESVDAEEFYDELDDLYDEIEDAEDKFEDFVLKVTFRISKSKNQLIALDVEAGNDDDEVTAGFVCAPDWKSPTYISFQYDAGYETVDLRYAAEDSKDSYDGRLTVKSDGQEVMAGSVSWDKEDGDFTVKASSYSWWSESLEEIFLLKGNLDKDGGTSVYSLKSLEVEGQSMRLNGIVITVKESDKMPVIRDYTDLLTMSEDDVEDMIGDVEDFVSSFESEAGGILSILSNLLY